MTQIPLSSIAPDVDAITSQLQQKLAAKPVWSDTVDDATGQFIIEMIAASTALDQHAIERVVQEISIENARMPSTLYANAAIQGTRLIRKTPASQEVLFTRTNTAAALNIPPYTQFNSPAGLLFNRQAIIFQAGNANPDTTTLQEITAFINTGTGTLAPGVYEYRVVGIDAQGRAHPSSLKTISLTLAGGVLLSWETIGVAVEYRVYGRTPGTLDLIASGLAPNVLSFLDDGTLTPNSLEPFPAIPTTGTVYLYQGEVRTAQTTITSTADRRFFISEEANFTVSNFDVKVAVNSNPVPVVFDGMWNYAGQNAVQDRTTSKGRLNIVFGTSLYGYFPLIGDNIVILYVVTTGSAANSQETGEEVSSALYPDVSGITITPLTGGTNERPYSDYKDSPLLFAARDRAVRQQDYNAIARLYPGVADAYIQGQRDIDVTSNQYMNLFRACILPKEGTWTGAQFNDFVNYMQSVCIAGARFFRYDPKEFPFDLDIDIYCANNSDLATIKFINERNLNDFYSRRRGILNFNSFSSDIVNLIKKQSPAVDYIIINSPKFEIITDVKSPEPLLEEIPIVGNLLAGNYTYFVFAKTSEGFVPSQGPFSISVDLNSDIRITIEQTSPIITEYVIFRIDNSTTYEIATLAATPSMEPLSFIDDTQTPPIGELPTFFNAGIWYPKLNSLTVRTLYTQR